MSTPFPAILIGGPPHSGKSVLIYSITQALRKRNISHYALRACPDAEGDWANEIPQPVVRILRKPVKGVFTPDFTNRVINYLKKRHLPLLVDVGGKPQDNQFDIFSECTHAILLVADNPESPATYEQNLTYWREMMRERDVPIIAEIQSTLTEASSLIANDDMIIGRQAGLERGDFADGPVFDALIDKIATLFTYDEQHLAQIHEDMRPRGTQYIDLPKLSAEIGDGNRFWEVAELPQLIERVPAKRGVSVYGRSAIWIYTALTMNAYPAPFASYDAKLGWVLPPYLPNHEVTEDDDWTVALIETENYLLLEMNVRSQYLDIEDLDKIPLPSFTTDKGLMLSGRLPIWLYCAVARQCSDEVPWIAIYQPQLEGGAIIYTKDPKMPVGTIIPREVPPETG